jgi:hypothetical protein
MTIYNQKTVLSFCAILLIVIAVLLSFFVQASANAAINDSAQPAVQAANNLLGTDTFEPVDGAELSALQADFGSGLNAAENENYVLMYHGNDATLRVLLLKQNPIEPMFAYITNETEAVDTIVTFVSEANPDFFASDNYDVIIQESGNDVYPKYTVELWEKIGESFYSGNKIAALIGKDGNLISYIAKESTAKRTEAVNTEALISENEAIDLAYGSLIPFVASLEQQEQSTAGDSVEKNGSDVIMSDTGEIVDTSQTVPKEAYDIMLEDTAEQSVVAYRELNKNGVLWVIKISHVITNREWAMGFVVAVNAETGSIDYIWHTR